MKIQTASWCLVILLTLLSACGGTGADAGPEILGVRLGMSKDEAHERLQKLGKLEKEERKKQEVWALQNDESYSHVILAYEKDYAAVRFVTAVAKVGGRRVRYSDVVDVKEAEHAAAEPTHTYTIKMPAKDGHPSYVVRATGSDPEYLKYYSVEKVD